MMAKLHEGAFDDPDWIFEIKWDGYRAVADVTATDSRLYSRNGLSFNSKYPVVIAELEKIRKKIRKDIVLDGEIVAFNDKDMPDFQLLQQYGTNNQVPLVYYVFDLLYLDGKSLKEKTVLERKEILRQLLPASDTIKYCDHIKGKGKAFFDATEERGLEGMIAKKSGSLYYEGHRSNDWLKVKQIQTEEAIICGYTAPRGGRKYFGALILGMYENDELKYIGHTGTGFNHTSLKQLHNTFNDYKSDTSPFKERVPVNTPVTWLEPKLVCNIKYSEITQVGIRRHPVYLGLRVDKQPEEANKTQNERAGDKTDNMEVSKTIGGKKLVLTNLDKVYFPEEGYTKGDIIDYYSKVSKYILKYLKDRPESLRRNPNGIKDEGFFHKDVGDSAPDWVDKYVMYSESADKEINYIMCNDKASLLYIANLGCIEINPWNSRVSSPDDPDYLVMDLDPSENNTFDQVVEAANVVHQILDKAGCANYCKTSGATGLHIYVPLGAQYSYEQARMFAEMIATLTVEQLPGFTSIERSLKKRGKGNIYIDYLQNKSGQTLSCAYSARPKPGATVSTPLEWEEVKPGLQPTDFTIRNILQRLERKGDLFSLVLKKGINMEKALKKLGS